MNGYAKTQCLDDLREAHEFATLFRDEAQRDGSDMRVWIWNLERERLARLFRFVKEGAGPDGRFPGYRQ
jgi:hypothetical protein